MINLKKVSKYGYDFVSSIIHYLNSMFLLQVTEEEVQKVTSKLKRKFCAGYDEILENIVKQCIQFIKEH
jgi:selenophosphate synthetase-related protein